MQEPIDETDGTPAWAKAMFRRWQAIRTSILVLMTMVGLPLIGGYELYRAVFHGQVWRITLGRSCGLVSFADEPVHFTFGVALAIFLLVIWGMGLALYHRFRRIPEQWNGSGRLESEGH